MMIAFEGPDGSGKTTQLRLVADRLLSMGASYATVPGCSSSPIGRYIRECLSGRVHTSPQEMQALYTADRMARDEELRSESAIGSVLLADRWTLSAYVYGSLDCDTLATKNERLQWLAKINESVIRPSVYVVVNVEPEIAIERVAKRVGKQPIEIYENAETLRRICASYRDRSIVPAALRWFGARPHVLMFESTREHTPESMHEEVWRQLAPILAIG